MRIAPYPPPTSNTADAITIAALRAENASLIASLAALHMRFDALQNAASPPQATVVVHSLCARIVELTASGEAMQRKAQRLQQKLEAASRCAEDLREQVRQLQGGIAEVQDANHSKAAELCRLKRDVAKIKEHLTCTISQDIMQRVCIFSTGQAYNRDSIAEWLWRSGSNRCPNTGRNVQWYDYQPATSPALDEVCAIVARM